MHYKGPLEGAHVQQAGSYSVSVGVNTTAIWKTYVPSAGAEATPAIGHQSGSRTLSGPAARWPEETFERQFPFQCGADIPDTLLC